VTLAWVCFDLNGTLTDPRALTGDDRGPEILDDAVLLAMADTLSGGIRPFPEYLRAALDRAVPELADRAMERLAQLPAQPDAAEALALLRDAGHRIAVVTNSAREAGERSLAAAGLSELVETVIGADGAGAYKPDPRVYAHAARELGAPPAELCLVAAHAWDVLGAMRAGWQGAWAGHRERRLLSLVPTPLAAGATLLEVARQLADLR